MIKSIEAKKILDSRRRFTVKVSLKTEKGRFSASCPSGASIGRNEAAVLPAEKAVKNVNGLIAGRLVGLNEAEQGNIDKFLINLDGTKNKRNLGANAI